MTTEILRRHNYRQSCTKRKDCDCADCCLCRVCLFLRRSGSLYRGMQSRLKERKWKSGKRTGEVRVEKRPLPYTLEQFRAWLTCVLEDTPRCEYCQTPLNIMNISPDHATPITRGGSLALANLRGACRDCNSVKGSLLPGEFRALMSGLKTFTEDGRADVLRRLRGAAVHLHKPKGKPAARLAAPAGRDSTTAMIAFPPMSR